MSSLEYFMGCGRELGHEGQELRDFVEQQQALERDERQQKRAHDREAFYHKHDMEQHRLVSDSEKLEWQTEKLKMEIDMLTQRLENTQVGQREPEETGACRQAPRPKLPPFDERCDSIDAYIVRFEAYAEGLRWRREGWAISLAALLTGRALQIFSSLSRDSQRNYSEVKQALLKNFDFTEDGFRKRFQGAKLENGETFSQYGVRVEHFFSRWLELSGVENTFEGLKDFILREQMLSTCSTELIIHLKQAQVQTVSELVKTAEIFRVARQKRFVSSDVPKGNTFALESDKATGRQKTLAKDRRPRGQREARRCWICDSTSHIARDCRSNKRANAVRWTSADRLCSRLEKMPVEKGSVNDIEVSCLRDTGSDAVIVRKSLVKKESMTGEKETCALADGTIRRCPTAKIWVKSPFFEGEVIALLMENPLYDLIIGNVPGVKRPDVDSGAVSESAAVNTRSQSLKEKPKPLKVVTDYISATPGEISIAQKQDSSLKPLWERVGAEDRQIKLHGSERIIEQGGLLYREYTNRLQQKVVVQLVTPQDFRKTVLTVAHEGLMSGHMGKGKTADRVMSNFYWPGVMADVRRFCASCDICQRTIPKGRTPKAPLGQMPLIEEPFQRVSIDLIGPLPVSRGGYRYALTLVDFATRYPEAIALKGIDTVQVAEALLEIFSRVGVPAQILSDQGTQFMSDVMKEVTRLLGVKQLRSTPYHPQCNGLVERFNGTLKLMLEKMCCEQPKEWDRFLPAMLFAYREVPQSSLGFSPFEMLYGRTVRGPMTILKELWTREEGETEVKTTYQYVVDLRQRLQDTCRYAQTELCKARQTYRRHFNKKAKSRHFDDGSKVLLLLPTDNNKLLMHWKGPFVVEGKSGMNDYKLNVGGKTKLFHINMLRQYIERQEDSPIMKQASGVSVVHEVDSSGEGILLFPTLVSTETYKDVHICCDLSHEQQNVLEKINEENKHVLTDLPGVCKIEVATIRLDTAEPVKAKPYPLPYATRDIIGAEVKKMLEMGIIEKSNSPYCAPLVAVRKSDGSHRVCVDLRSLNKRTVLDAEPMPNAEDLFAKISSLKGKFFSKLDLSKGYWQINLSEDSKEKTAFSTPLGLFQFNVLPFGWVNAGAVFTRMMRKLLDGMEGVVNFMDDICVATETWEEHVCLLKEVFDRIEKAGLTARPSKCFLGFPSLQFLGFELGEGSKKPEESKVEKILKAPSPKTKKQVRALLGLVGYYREFVPNFAALTAPLSDLTKKGQPDEVVWNKQAEEALASVKERLASYPILRLPDFSEPFILRTDASGEGIGAVLLQEENEQKFPIQYASRKLSDCEKRYAVSELECLAVVWAVNKFQKYLYGKRFVIETDHEALAYLGNRTLNNSRLLRWALTLQPFSYDIKVIPGKENIGADFLSRVC